MASTGTMSDYLANATLDHSMGDAAYTAPAQVYLALCSTAVTASMTGGSITEMSEHGNHSSGYARVILAKGSFGNATSRNKDYAADIDFGEQVTTGDIDLVSWAIVDHADVGSGNVLFYGTFDPTPQTVSNGVTVKVLSGNLDIGIKTDLG